MAGGARRTACLQFLPATGSGGRQPRIRHDVNDPLLLAPQKERTNNPSVGAGLFAAAAIVSTLEAATSENWPLPQQLATGTPQGLGKTNRSPRTW